MLTLLVVPLLLLGCPVEDPAVAAAAAAASAPPSGDPGAPPPAPAGGPVGDAAASSAGLPGEPTGLVAPFAAAPGLASLITDGKSITLSGKIIGSNTAQLDIQTTQPGNAHAPLLLEVIKVIDGTFSVKAPATYATPLYITAIGSVPEGDKTPPLGGASDAVKLEGKDVAVEITLSSGPEWLAKMPWGIAPPPGEGAAPPP